MMPTFRGPIIRLIDRLVVIHPAGKRAHAHAARPQEVEGRLVVQVHGIEKDAKMASTSVGVRCVCTNKGKQTWPGPEQPLEAVGLALVILDASWAAVAAGAGHDARHRLADPWPDARVAARRRR